MLDVVYRGILFLFHGQRNTTHWVKRTPRTRSRRVLSGTQRRRTTRSTKDRNRTHHTDKDVATKVKDVATKKGGRAANKSHERRDSVHTLEP